VRLVQKVRGGQDPNLVPKGGGRKTKGTLWRENYRLRKDGGVHETRSTNKGVGDDKVKKRCSDSVLQELGQKLIVSGKGKKGVERSDYAQNG